MLHQSLNNAVCNLKSLIELNLLDIDDIKEARHEQIFNRLETKNNLIDSFKKNKSLADSEMRKLVNRFPNKKIEELLDDNAMKLIDDMRVNLKTLKELNKNYAKSVLAVYEFYNSLIESIIPSQKVGYLDKVHSKADLMSIEA
ncbi:hypothetical protein [Helicobacter sp. MIT 14-3879]|uniref:hypothetical protein n=1 Tax=Helicobacter sp. MIT 14-3879 TaxID=2040649 RepID=UPI000E1E6284|nr:hypothetical protein [Helicobacter sp. MIT 14-3879]RDU65082.1 hypothetical protein CQA44_01870 [Helicobacter sp. MIT 14-3879]